MYIRIVSLSKIETSCFQSTMRLKLKTSHHCPIPTPLPYNPHNLDHGHTYVAIMKVKSEPPLGTLTPQLLLQGKTHTGAAVLGRVASHVTTPLHRWIHQQSTSVPTHFSYLWTTPLHSIHQGHRSGSHSPAHIKTLRLNNDCYHKTAHGFTLNFY